MKGRQFVTLAGAAGLGAVVPAGTAGGQDAATTGRSTGCGGGESVANPGVGLWNEADRMLWRRDDLTVPTVEWPDGLDVDPATYSWSVSALQNGQEIAKFGMSAFVVE